MEFVVTVTAAQPDAAVIDTLEDALDLLAEATLVGSTETREACLVFTVDAAGLTEAASAAGWLLGGLLPERGDLSLAIKAREE